MTGKENPWHITKRREDKHKCIRILRKMTRKTLMAASEEDADHKKWSLEIGAAKNSVCQMLAIQILYNWTIEAQHLWAR